MVAAVTAVVLTGVASVVSFGQAMFVGFGAYTTAILTTRYGWPPIATLPIAMGLTGILAWGIGAITLRLKGHYLPVATIAWNISFFYLTGGLDFFQRHEDHARVVELWGRGLDLSPVRDTAEALAASAAASRLPAESVAAAVAPRSPAATALAAELAQRDLVLAARLVETRRQRRWPELP